MAGRDDNTGVEFTINLSSQTLHIPNIQRMLDGIIRSLYRGMWRQWSSDLSSDNSAVSWKGTGMLVGNSIIHG